MARVIVAPRAQTDLANILEYLAQEAGIRIALEYRERFRVLYRLLASYPGIGFLRPALGQRIRVSVVAPYLVLYRDDGDIVRILRIVHGRRKLPGAAFPKRR